MFITINDVAGAREEFCVAERAPSRMLLNVERAAGTGVFVSCLPGRLAYFEGEDVGARYVLERDV